MLESCSSLGLRMLVAETVSLAGKRVEIRAPVQAGDADSLADRALQALGDALGANSLLWHGELVLEASGLASAEELARAASVVEERGFRVNVTGP
jgi:hypothetical protein